MTEPNRCSQPAFNASALQRTARVLSQRQLAKDTYCVRLEAPEIASRIVPGQFFMVRSAAGNNPLLGRPFALYDTVVDGSEAVGIEFAYVVVGKLTSLMAAWKPGDRAQIWGPLGNGFPLPAAGHLMLVAGGIGQTPFLAVAREALGLRTYGDGGRTPVPQRCRVTLCYGVRSAAYLAGVDDFSSLGLEIRLATDDGSRAHRGFVTDLLAQSLESNARPERVYCCGPEPMMHAAAQLCAKARVPCWLSLESPMACGFGACFSCVAAVKVDGGSWDYRRTCIEGPVFPADRLVIASSANHAGELAEGG